MVASGFQSLGGSGRVVLGEIRGVHGLGGEIRVKIAGDSASHLIEVDTVWIGKRLDDPEARRRKIVDRGLARAGEVRLKLDGVKHRAEVQDLVGQLVLASRDLLPNLPDGEFYWYELIGCRVDSESGEPAGVVREIWETGAHDVLVVEDEDGARRLIPTAQELMTKIDLEGRRIVVVDLPGLMEPI